MQYPSEGTFPAQSRVLHSMLIAPMVHMVEAWLSAGWICLTAAKCVGGAQAANPYNADSNTLCTSHMGLHAEHV